jgi:4-hydroxybenzoate polyprenyltransferase and related prenyltransferases
MAPGERRSSRAAPLLAALRPHHWSKNLLVLLPVVAGHRFSAEVLARAALAFACFCVVASSGYLINDLIDRAADRAHPRKKDRAIASGALGRGAAAAVAAVLGIAGLAASWAITPALGLVLATYLAGSVLYSTVLKQFPIVDVVVLAGLFTLRVIGGAEATSIALSHWLLSLSLFLFLALAIAKRCGEVADAAAAGEMRIAGRGYRAIDLPTLSALGAAAGYAAALVLALYIASPEVRLLYARPERLWLSIPFLVYWLSRVQLLAARGELHDDPIIFAFRDRATWIAAVCVAAIVTAAV